MEKSQIKGMVFAALFAALTGAVAWFKIPLPFTPVPITLQTLAVLLSGAMLGAYFGALSMIIYLILGSIGLPVFAGGSSGFGAILGPSGGYLLSYPIASFAIGFICKKESRRTAGSKIESLVPFLFGILIAAFIVFTLSFLLKIFGIVDLQLIKINDLKNLDYKFFLMLATFMMFYLFYRKINIKNKYSKTMGYISTSIVLVLLLIIFVDSL